MTVCVHVYMVNVSFCSSIFSKNHLKDFPVCPLGEKVEYVIRTKLEQRKFGETVLHGRPPLYNG